MTRRIDPKEKGTAFAHGNNDGRNRRAVVELQKQKAPLSAQGLSASEVSLGRL
jgi:hypothetical protein